MRVSYRARQGSENRSKKVPKMTSKSGQKHVQNGVKILPAFLSHQSAQTESPDPHKDPQSGPEGVGPCPLLPPRDCPGPFGGVCLVFAIMLIKQTLLDQKFCTGPRFPPPGRSRPPPGEIREKQCFRKVSFLAVPSRATFWQNVASPF